MPRFPAEQRHGSLVEAPLALLDLRTVVEQSELCEPVAETPQAER